MLIKAKAELGFDYTLKCSAKRRTVSLSIRAGEISVNAPVGVCLQELQTWLASKQAWVQSKLQQQSEHAAEIPKRLYSDGEQLRFLGVDYPLQIQAAARSKVVFCTKQGFSVELGPSRGDKGSAERVQQLLQAWYKRQALQLLSAKTEQLCAQMGLVFDSVIVRRTKSKWGHCTSKGVIQYNWLILVAPNAVVDYLVAHEVCHLRHHNHSRAFWDLVESVCPDYRESKAWLQRYGHTLTV